MGVRDLDDASQFEVMLQLKAACEAADCDYPPQLVAYFRKTAHLTPQKSPEQLRRSATTVPSHELGGAVSEWSDLQNGKTGYEVQLDKIPEGVKALRFIL